MNVLDWLRKACATYSFEPVAIYREPNLLKGELWPMTAIDNADLTSQLRDGGFFLSLPTEPAALANVVEESITDFLAAKAKVDGLDVRRGKPRSYPDLELFGDKVGRIEAIDVKVARRGKSRRQTQSRITLYTGNTFFKYPTLHWPGNFRPFDDYARHLDVVVLYDLDLYSESRVSNVEVIVHEPWRIASKQRSSTTREYLGAIMDIEKLRNGKGEFDSPDAFYKFWRAHPFRVGAAVANQLAKLLAGPKPPKEKKSRKPKAKTT